MKIKQPKFCKYCGAKLVWLKEDTFNMYTGKPEYRLVCKHYISGVTSAITPRHMATEIYK